jgi:hypothetical protein
LSGKTELAISAANFSSTMVKLKTNHRHPRGANFPHTQRNFASLLTSSNLKRWIIILFLFYKLDYKDYYCYGISSSSAILNNENGKNPRFFLLHLEKVNLLSRLFSSLSNGALCPVMFSFFPFFISEIAQPSPRL